MELRCKVCSETLAHGKVCIGCQYCAYQYRLGCEECDDYSSCTRRIKQREVIKVLKTKETYEVHFKKELDSKFTLVCPVCGRVLFGNAPYIEIPCKECYEKGR